MTEQFIKNTNSEKVYYNFTPGVGPLVVFLGGYFSDMQGSKALMFEAYAKENNLAYLRMDYSGHGMSEGDFLSGGVGVWAQDAVRVIEHVSENKDVILIGSSMGGWIMLLVALQLKKQVKGLLGIASAPDFTERLVWAQMTEEHKKILSEQGKLPMGEPMEENSEPLYISRQIIEDGRKHLLLNAPIALDIPMILLHGMRDKEVPWETSLALCDAVNSDLVHLRLFKKGNHRLSTNEHLHELKRGLQDLLQRIYQPVINDTEPAG